MQIQRLRRKASAQHVSHPFCGLRCCQSSPGGGKWVEITIPMDPLYLSVLVSAEKKVWRCVKLGKRHTSSMRAAAPRIEAIRILELKSLMLEDAREAIGHGVRLKRSKSGAVTFDLLETGAGGSGAR